MNNKSKKINIFTLNNYKLEKVKNLIHLGLPLGNAAYIKEYWVQKITKTIKSYALKNIGCKRISMSPRIMAQIYRIYCQPIMSYSLEILYINKTKIEELDKMQALMIKNKILQKYTTHVRIRYRKYITTIPQIQDTIPETNQSCTSN